MSELEKYKEKIFLGLKRKPVQIFTYEELQAMEQKTNDEYENSDNEMIVEDDDFFKKIINQSLFIHIGNCQYILDYERIQKNPNLILPKSFGNLNNNVYNNWSCSVFINYFKEDGKDVSDEVIKRFASCTQYFTNGKFSQLLMDYDNYSNKNKVYKDLLSEIDDSDIHRDFNTPLIFVIKEKMKLDMLYIPTKKSKDYQKSKDYLERIKKVLDLPNEVEKEVEDKKSLLYILEEKDNNYILVNDTFKKMVLLIEL